MNRFLFALSTAVFTFLIGSNALAQCGTNTAFGTFCNRAPNGLAPGGVAYLYGTLIPNCGTFASTPNNFGPGQYFQMPVLAGGCYSVSTCGSSVDTQISCFQGTATTGPYAYNDDSGPLCTGVSASVNITPSFTDYTRVQVSQYNCQPGGTASITVSVRQNNNLSIISSSAAMCEGQTRGLTATPSKRFGNSYIWKWRSGDFYRNRC